VILLDEVANAEGCPMVQLREFMVHFHLSDDGALEFEGFGEETEGRIWSWAYPLLDETLSRLPEIESKETVEEESPPELKAAVEEERHRVKLKATKQPQTFLGKDIKDQTGMPTPIVDKIVQQTATKALENLKDQEKKPN